MEFTKDSRMVQSALLLMRNKGLGAEDIDTFVPDLFNIREVVRQCLEE